MLLRVLIRFCLYAAGIIPLGVEILDFIGGVEGLLWLRLQGGVQGFKP